MKQLTPIDVFEFKDEEFPDDSDRWSKIRAKIGNPNFDRKSEPVTQIKEVPTVTIDDDDDDDDHMDDTSRDPLDSSHKPVCEESEDLYPIPEKVVERHSGLNDSNVEHTISPPCTQIKVSTSPEYLPGNGHVFTNGAVYFDDFEGVDMIQEGSPTTSDSEAEENNDPIAGQDPWQSVGGLEMDVVDTVMIHTDYVKYGDKYFPASLILFSRDSVTVKPSVLDEDLAASISVWKLDDILQVETQESSLADVTKVRIRMLTNNSSEIAVETAGVIVVEFLVPNWSHHQEQIMSLHVRYNAVLSMGIDMRSCDTDAAPLEDTECSSDPFIPNFEEHFEDVVYPKGEIDAVSLRKSDVDLLEPGVFVNDTIIDFYMTYLKNGIPKDRRDNFHFFNSFFFRKLADLDKNPNSTDGKAAFQRVKRWTRKVNIFEKDYIIIPVNYSLHWSLIILCHLGEAANFDDENVDKALKVPCILHLDSIRGNHAGLKDLLQSYLLEEWKERNKETSVDVSSKFLNLRFLSLELPQQENCSDCGLFLLHYAELFIDEAPENFSPFLINEFDNFLKPDWFMPAEASLKRVHIQRLIYELLKSISHKCASPPRNYISYSQPIPVNKENDNDNDVDIVSEKRSLEKSWNERSLYSEPAQGMEMGLLDMRQIYRPSLYIGNSGLGMTELLEQQCQHHDQGASLGSLEFSMSTIREQEGDEHLVHPNLGQPGQSHIDCSSGDFDQGFAWNLDMSDQEDPDNPDATSYSSDSRSCDDNSSEETKILDWNPKIQSASPCQNDTDQSKENFESQEGYASASSDMMATPAEDSQELAEKYGKSDYDLEDVVEPSEEYPAKSEHEENALSSVDEKMRSTRKSDYDIEDVVEAAEEPAKSEHDEIGTLSSVDERTRNTEKSDYDLEDVVEAGEEEPAESDQEEIVTLSSVDEKMSTGKSDDGLVVEASEEEPAESEQEEIVTLSSVDEKIRSNGKSDYGVEDVVKASEEDPAKSEHEEIVTLTSADEKLVVENGKIEDEEVVGNDENWIVGDSPPEQPRPAKRLRVSPSPGDESV